MRTITRGVLGATSLVLIAYTLYIIIWPLRWRLLLVWPVVEALFFVCVFLPRYDRLNKQPQPHEPADHDAMRCWRRFLRYAREVPGGMDTGAYISGWYRGADPSQVKRGNLEEFVAYGFWYRSLQQMADAGLGHVPGQMVEELQAAWGVSFEPGYNPGVSFLGHLWEPLNASWRPLAFYLLVEGVGRGGRTLLRRWGFRRHQHSGLTYFTLGCDKPPPKSAAPGGNSNSSSTARVSCDATSSSSGCDLDSAAGDGVPQLAAAAAAPAGAGSAAAALPKLDQTVGAAMVEAADSTAPVVEAVVASANQLLEQQQQQQQQQQQPVPPKFTSTLSSVFEAQGSQDADWTPFAANSNSPAKDADTTPRNSYTDLSYRQPAPSAAAAAAAAAAHDSEQVAGRGSKGGQGLKLPAASAPVDGRSSSATAAAAAAADTKIGRDQSRQQGTATRAASAQPGGHPQMSLAHLPQLAPRTSQLLSAGTCPLQQVLTMTAMDAAPPGLPVLFLHGVGGLPAYLGLVLQMVAGGHPIIAVEFKGVSLRLGNVMTADEVEAAVVGMLDELRIERACVMAHSYGTFIASLLVRRHPQRVASLYLLDPVTIGMFMPYLLTNFLYRRFEWSGWNKAALLGVAKVAVRKLAANDLHLCATFARRFYWTDLNMWPEDLPPGSVVLLSGKDDLVDSNAVRVMLERAGHVQVVFNPELTHGAFLLVPEVKAAILGTLQQLITASGSAVAGLGRGLSSLLLSKTHTLTLAGAAGGSGAAPGGAASARRALPTLASVASTLLGSRKERATLEPVASVRLPQPPADAAAADS
ncbi:hypothetical protein OEZ85_000927 [Tetradesmus obliquus]|uniref:AB hydrolase-1 domain-containing protein n=1 Tax=Tetradesmus obliquus TaxID=3088 RepID=A0ABY8UKE6_TETOB|nr:hypothetical protein OEZ85_000927 [Tetradesmus obliquus]